MPTNQSMPGRRRPQTVVHVAVAAGQQQTVKCRCRAMVDLTEVLYAQCLCGRTHRRVEAAALPAVRTRVITSP